MGVITSENFDGVTPPAFPANWVVGAGIETESGASYSGSQAVGNTVDSTTHVAYYDMDDGNGGDAQVSAVLVPTIAGIGGSNLRVAWLLVRMTGAGTNINTLTGLFLFVNTVTGFIEVGKAASGFTNYNSATLSQLAGLAIPIKLYLTSVGSSLTARVQRMSDLKWLNVSNAWQSASVVLLAGTIGGLSGAGRAGIAMQRSNSGNLHYFDDFVFETAPVPARRRQGGVTYI